MCAQKFLHTWALALGWPSLGPSMCTSRVPQVSWSYLHSYLTHADSGMEESVDWKRERERERESYIMQLWLIRSAWGGGGYFDDSILHSASWSIIVIYNLAKWLNGLACCPCKQNYNSMVRVTSAKIQKFSVDQTLLSFCTYPLQISFGTFCSWEYMVCNRVWC